MLAGSGQLAEMVVHKLIALGLELTNEPLLALAALLPRLLGAVAGGGEVGVEVAGLKLVDVFLAGRSWELRLAGIRRLRIAGAPARTATGLRQLAQRGRDWTRTATALRADALPLPPPTGVLAECLSELRAVRIVGGVPVSGALDRADAHASSSGADPLPRDRQNAQN